MYVGHYAVALALKGAEPRASLGLLFLGVQLVDVAFFPLALLGIEELKVVPNATAATHFELPHMPWTHSLVASFLWATAAFVVWRLVSKDTRISLVFGLAVLSHWFMDLLVHTPDLPLLGGDSLKVGFGLWNYAGLTFLLEAALCLLALGPYLRATTPREGRSRASWSLPVYVLTLIAIHAGHTFGPPPGGKVFISLSALTSFLLFALIAGWLDWDREPAGQIS